MGKSLGWNIVAVVVVSMSVGPTLLSAAQTRFFSGAGDDGRPFAALTVPWVRPAVCAESAGPAFWESTSFYVSETGTYTVHQEVSAPSGLDPVPFPRALFLYAQSFDPSRPQLHLLSVHDVSDAAQEVTLEWQLVAHTMYFLVLSTLDQTRPELDEYEIMRAGWSLTGPGHVGQSSCRFTDDVDSDADGLRWNAEASMAPTRGAFPREQICVSVFWYDAEGRALEARVAPQRTRESVLFYFFDESNWEINVKVLDACDVNDSYWLLVSSSTDVPFDLEVRWLGIDAFIRPGSPHFVPFSEESPRPGTLVFRSDGGEPAQTLIDVRSIGCDLSAEPALQQR